MDLANLENYVWIYVHEVNWDQDGDFQRIMIGFKQSNIGVVPGNVTGVPSPNYIE